MRTPASTRSRTYAAPSYVQPSANVIVVTPGYSYGDDGVVMAHKRNDPSWKLCQTERSRRDDNLQPVSSITRTASTVTGRWARIACSAPRRPTCTFRMPRS